MFGAEGLMHPAYLFVYGGLAAGAGVSIYMGWKNLAQSKILAHDIHPARLSNHIERTVSVVGTPSSDYPGSDPFLVQRLWYHKRFQELRGRGTKNQRWVTVRDEEPSWDLTLQVGDTEVRVKNAPTEVYGTRTDYSGGGFGSDYRVVDEWLPRVPRLTVCGRLVRHGGQLWLLRDSYHGLLFATDPPHARARREALKGWLGLIGGPLLALGVAAYLSRLLPTFVL